MAALYGENKKRLCDLAMQSYRNDQYTFTNFLALKDLSEFNELIRLPKDREDSLACYSYSIWGGFDDAERVMIRFGNKEELGYEQPFPICCINIAPLQKKFTDPLSHRDFLGSLMNLGIERDMIGDILVKDKECFLFAKEELADIICQELTRVRHTTVIAKVCEVENIDIKPNLVSGQIQAKSARIDSFIAKVCKLSRGNTADLFVQSKVFVDGRVMSNESYQLKGGEIITVRGFGKMRFVEISGSTKKGNMIITYELYK